LSPLPSSRTSLQHAMPMSPHLHSSSVDSFTYPDELANNQGRTASIDGSPHLYYPYSSPPLEGIQMARTSSASTSDGVPSSDIGHQQQKKVNRQSTGSQQAVTRKTPRKPVPAYDPSVAGTSTFMPASSNPSTINIPSPATPTTPSLPFGSSNTGHYSKRSQQGIPGNESGTLVHKSSFGPGGVEGKPLHLLIPDMPPLNRKS
jgi:hypothetical protein